MGFVLKCVANREWRVFRSRQPVRRGERSPYVTPSVVLHLGMMGAVNHLERATI